MLFLDFLHYHFYIAECGRPTDWPSPLFLGLASLAANTALMLPFDGLDLMGLIAAAHLCQKLKLPYFYPLFLFIDIRVLRHVHRSYRTDGCSIQMPKFRN